MFKIGLDDARDLLKECGYAQAGDYSPARCKKKLEGLAENLDKDNQPEGRKAKKLLKELLAELKGEGKITVVGGEGETEEVGETKAPAKKEAAKKEEAKKETKKPAAKEEEEEEEDDSDEEEEDDEEESDDDDEEDEEEDDEEEEKPKSKKSGAKKGNKPPASAGKDGGPGIIASIVEFLQDATEDAPVTKKGILKKLEKRFPDRSSDAMQKTVNVQVPNRIKNDKGLEVLSKDTEKGGKAYWINPDKEAKKAPKSEKPSKKGNKKAKDEEEEDDEE